jgi:hypothetical protein
MNFMGCMLVKITSALVDSSENCIICNSDDAHLGTLGTGLYVVTWTGDPHTVS